MKKLIIILFVILLCGCSPKKEEYYNLSFGEYNIAIGYDNGEFLNVVFEYQVKENLEAYETIDDIELKYFGKSFGIASLSNFTKKPIIKSEAIISSISFYLADTGYNEFYINGTALDSSISKNCETFDGQLIQRNGYACLIEQTVGDKDNGIILYGNVANIDQDIVDHIEIFVK